MSFLEDHGLELLSALASTTAAVVAVLVYRRQSSGDTKVGWLLEKSQNGQIILVRTGGGIALDVSWTFEAGSMAAVYTPSGDPAVPDQRIPLGRAYPRSDYVAPGRMFVYWKQKRRIRTTSHSWSAQLP